MYISTWKKIKWWLLLVYKLCCESVLSNFILVLPRNNSHIHQVCTHCILGDSVAQYVASIAFLSFIFLLEILHPCDTGWYPRSCAVRGCQSLLWRQTNRGGGGGGGGLPSHLFSVLVSSPPKSFTFHHLHEAVDVDLQQCVGSVGEHLAKE